ncbi:Protein of unknown function, partial [Gryllus bimaculatus]
MREMWNMEYFTEKWVGAQLMNGFSRADSPSPAFTQGSVLAVAGQGKHSERGRRRARARLTYASSRVPVLKVCGLSVATPTQARGWAERGLNPPLEWVRRWTHQLSLST